MCRNDDLKPALEHFHAVLLTLILKIRMFISPEYLFQKIVFEYCPVLQMVLVFRTLSHQMKCLNATVLKRVNTVGPFVLNTTVRILLLVLGLST